MSARNNEAAEITGRGIRWHNEMYKASFVALALRDLFNFAV